MSNSGQNKGSDHRIGLGHDIHALVHGRDLYLGGVKIPFEKGLAGHSDADALLHSIMDALLGALALGYIGQWFPDTDPSYKGASSGALTSRVVAKVTELGYHISNVDCMIHCEQPKIGPHREEIRSSIAGLLHVPVDRVSVKAGTNEKFDAVGQGMAITCQAVVLLIKPQDKRE